MTLQSLIDEEKEEFSKIFLWTAYPTEISTLGSEPTTYFNKDVDPIKARNFLAAKMTQAAEAAIEAVRNDKSEKYLNEGMRFGYQRSIDHAAAKANKFLGK